MIGKLVSIEHVTDRYDEVSVQEIESNVLVRDTVERGSCDNYLNKYITIHSSVVKLANANAGDTILYGKKGF